MKELYDTSVGSMNCRMLHAPWHGADRIYRMCVIAYAGPKKGLIEGHPLGGKPRKAYIPFFVPRCFSLSVPFSVPLRG